MSTPSTWNTPCGVQYSRKYSLLTQALSAIMSPTVNTSLARAWAKGEEPWG
ncbi:hypothetical protein D3C76_701920 [compost metagenome]